MFIAMFYTSNLRGNLVAVSYEKEVKTVADVLARDESIPIYIPVESLQFLLVV
jgi:hypothetical protein